MSEQEKELDDDEIEAIVRQQTRYTWYIAPYYGSKEQYLYGRCDNMSMFDLPDMENLGKVIFTDPMKGENFGPLGSVIYTDAGKNLCLFSRARYNAFSNEGGEMLEGFYEYKTKWNRISSLDSVYPEKNIYFEQSKNGVFLDIDMTSAKIIKEVGLRMAGKNALSKTWQCYNEGHLELVLEDTHKKRHIYRFLVAEGKFMVISGFDEESVNCIKNSGQETLIVDSGFHYCCAIEPENEMEIDPKNGMYRKKR